MDLQLSRNNLPVNKMRFGFKCVCFISLLLIVLNEVLLSFSIRTKICNELVYFAEKYRLLQPAWIRDMKPLSVNITSNRKVILFYTPYFRTMPWSQTKGKELDLKAPTGKRCSCFVTYSRQDLQRSDAVLFHSQSHMMPLENELRVLLSQRKTQKWIWFTEENPVKSEQEKLPNYNNMFDMTISYHRKSTILSLYGYYYRNTDRSRVKQVEKQLRSESFSTGKDRLVLWFASNCVKPRLDIVRKIAKYIEVDVYGNCKKYFSNQKPGVCEKYSSECNAMAKRYKFYLAIENHQCEDYVTEKYWKNALSRDIVPVVVAGKYNKDIMIPGSYIDLLDFPNAKSLANYLRYLDSNNTAYNMYFAWKKKYISVAVTKPSWICELCEFLHKNNSSDNRKWDIETFWSVAENCLANEDDIRHWIT